jgi:hypothetical protein
VIDSNKNPARVYDVSLFRRRSIEINR